MKCPVCDSKNIESKKITHKYKESGLSNITLLNVTQVKCSDCGEEIRRLGDEAQLLSAIASILIRKTTLLKKEELRFLRTFIGYSSTMFSKILSVSKEHYSRIENGKADITQQFDRLIRFSILPKLPNPDRNYDLHDQILDENIDKTSAKTKTLKFKIKEKKWQPEKSVQ